MVPFTVSFLIPATYLLLLFAPFEQEHLSQIILRQVLLYSKRCWFMAGIGMGAKQHIHQWADIGIVARVTVFVVMPVVKFGRAE